ncbi:MAG: ArdC family protein [Cyanobium sp. CZS 48M]|nr:ArdC family protein [Cyanobium sp. CZS48M]
MVALPITGYGSFQIPLAQNLQWPHGRGEDRRLLDRADGGRFVPLRRPWDGSGGGHHVNLISRHCYRGANPILLTLGMHIRASALPFWCGFAEAKKLGIFPRRGSKAVHILRPQLHRREEPGAGREVTLESWAASYRPVAIFNPTDLEGEALPALIEARKAA